MRIKDIDVDFIQALLVCAIDICIDQNILVSIL